MTDRINAKRINRILVPTDFSEGAAGAFRWAIQVARRTGAEVVLLHALGLLESDAWGPLHYSPEQHVLRERTGKIITDLMGATLAKQDTDGVRVMTETRPGSAVAPAVVAAAKAQRADLIVMGTHGRRGARRLLLGSVAEEVVRTAPCPVLLVRERGQSSEAEKVRQILVPVDFSSCSRQVLPWAQALASAFEARLILLHVLDYFPTDERYYTAGVAETPVWTARAREEVQALAAEVAAPGAAVASYVEEGYPSTCIVDFAGEHSVDLIALSSHGRTGLSRFLMGSVAEKVVRTAPCPVLVVRAAVEAEPPAATDRYLTTVTGSDG